MCFAAFLWAKNEKEIVKKHLLAEVYKETMKNVFSELDENSTLMLAMKSSLRGTDYP